MRLHQYIPQLLTAAHGVVYAKHITLIHLFFVEAKGNCDGAA